MSTESEATKITQLIERKDGSEVRIVAESMVGEGLHPSIGVYVHKRESKDNEWLLCNDRPHTDWRSMSVEEYKLRGRSEMLQTVSSGELLRAISLIGAPMSQFEQLVSEIDAELNGELNQSSEAPRPS